MRKSEGTWHPEYTPESMSFSLKQTTPNGYDFVTGAGGGLEDFKIIAKDDYGNGIMHIQDTWDLNPFSREKDVLGARI